MLTHEARHVVDMSLLTGGRCEENLPESDSEVQPSRVTLKTVFTICFGVLIVIGPVMAIIHSLVAITLTYAALLLAVTLDHGVKMLYVVVQTISRNRAGERVAGRSSDRARVHADSLRPSPKQDAGRSGPHLDSPARASRLFGRLDARFHLADHIDKLEEGFPAMLEGGSHRRFGRGGRGAQPCGRCHHGFALDGVHADLRGTPDPRRPG